jgi:hypothetical protein
MSMDWSFDWNRSGPKTAGDWLVFYFVVPSVQFLFIGLIIGPATALKLFGAGILIVFVFGEVNAMMERRESNDIEAINERMRSVRKVGAVISGAMLVAYAVHTIGFPQARLGAGQGFLIVVAALVILGVVNNRRRP